MNRAKIYSFCVLIMLIGSSSFSCYGQGWESQDLEAEPIYRHYTVDDGLPSSECYDIIQDKKGYIWVATNMGVSRFDGYQFENFDMDDGLPDNTIFKLYEDYKGRIWFLSFSLQLSYFYNDSIYEYEYNGEIKSRTNKKTIITSFYVDKEDNIYIGIFSYGFFLIKKGGEIENFDSEESSFILFQIDSANLFDVHTSVFGHRSIRVKRRWGSENGIRDIDFNIQDSNWSIHGFSLFYDNNLWLYGHGNNLIFLDSEDSFILTLESTLYGIYKYDEFLIVIVTEKGMKVIDIYERMIIEEILIHEKVSSFLKDNSGNEWFSTLDNGIFYSSEKEIKKIISSPFLNLTKVTSLEKIEDDFLFANRTNILLKKGKKYFRYKMKFKNISDLYYDQSTKKIFISGSGAYLISEENLIRITPYVTTNKIKQISEYGICFGGSKELFKYNQHELFKLKSKIMRYESLSEYPPLNSIYIGNPHGLWLMKNDSICSVQDKHPLLSSRVIDLETINKELFVATRGKGLLIYDPLDNHSVHQITEEDGLASNNLNHLFYKDGVVWVSTNRGVSQIKIENQEERKFSIQNINTYDGLPSNEVNQVYVQDSTAWVGTNRGLAFFDVEKIQPNTYPPPVYMKSVTINNRESNLDSSYTLEHNQNYIQLKYVGLSYKNAGHVQYKYMMEGLDTNWRYTYNTNVQYTTLPPGEYKFIVAAQNEDGYWSTKPASVYFSILPPFWETTWFKISMGFCAALLVGSVFYSQDRRLKKKAQLKDEINEYKMQALSAQMNPHFIFNSLNSIQNFIFKDDKRGSNKYLAKFARLMRLVLDNSQSSTVTLKSELEALTLYLELESLRFKEKFDYEIKVDADIDTEEIQIPALLIQPHVENAIWHGLMNKEEKGNILVELHDKEDHILCVIEDDGVGRKKAMEIKNNSESKQQHQSKGIAITEKRLELISEFEGDQLTSKVTDLYDDKGNPNGTRIEILINI